MPGGSRRIRSSAARSFLQQGRAEQHRWYQVVEFKLSEIAQAEWQAGKLKNVAPEFETPKNLFGDTDMGSHLYPTYRNLSRLVHPTATTFARYSEQTPHRLLSSRLRLDQDPEGLAYYLACGTMMRAVPYLAALGTDHAAVSLRIIAGMLEFSPAWGEPRVKECPPGGRYSHHEPPLAQCLGSGPSARRVVSSSAVSLAIFRTPAKRLPEVASQQVRPLVEPLCHQFAQQTPSHV